MDFRKPEDSPSLATPSRNVVAFVCLGLNALLPFAVSAEPSRSWVLRLDLLDVDGGGRMNQRHFQQGEKRTVVCCLDLAWMPWNPGNGNFQFGAGLDVGGWKQDMEVGPQVQVADILLEASTRWVGSGATVFPWARLDAGPALLVVERRQVGVDWGVGGAMQAGFALPGSSADLLVGAGVDFRRYANLRVADLPAMTISVGVGL